MNHFELVPLKNGVMSLRALEPRETFHPGVGPVEEATVLHVKQQRLVERCSETENFQLWDVGFGAGANVITALRQLQKIDSSRGMTSVHSFDRTTAPMEFALQNAKALGYPLGFETQVRELLERGRVQVGPRLSWELHLGDFSQQSQDSRLPAPHAIFYDPYSPVGNPEMWTVENFKNLLSKLNPERSCLLTNYTRSTRVRVSMLLAGFSVGVGCSVHEKDETTIASNCLASLTRPLGRAWLEKRVRVSHSAAPLRHGSYLSGPIGNADFEMLSGLPQFQG